MFVRWFGRRVVVPLAPEAGRTPANGILSDSGGIFAAEWPPLLLAKIGEGTTVTVRIPLGRIIADNF